MPAYTITPIRAQFVERARSKAIDDQGQPVRHLIAEGGEPCRDTLRRAVKGEALILASYCPFDLAGPYREYGAVFITATEAPQGATDLPLIGAPPYLGAAFALRGYSAQEDIVDAVLSAPASAHEQLAALLANDKVAFVLVRFAAYGCYACRIDRAS